jgi:hypothetical protein
MRLREILRRFNVEGEILRHTYHTLPSASALIANWNTLIDIQALLLLLNAASDSLLKDNRETIVSRTLLLCGVVINAARVFLPESTPTMTHKREYTSSWRGLVGLSLMKLAKLFIIIVCCLAVKYSDVYLVLVPVVFGPIQFLIDNLPKSDFLKWYHGREWIVAVSMYLLLAWIKYFLVNNSTIAVTVYSLNFDVQLLILYPVYGLLDFAILSPFQTLRDVYFFLHHERDKSKVLYGWEDLSFQEAMLRVCHKGSGMYRDCQQFCVKHQIGGIAEMDRPLEEKAPLI